MRARVAVSTLQPTPNPEGIQGVEPEEDPPNGHGHTEATTDEPTGRSASNQDPPAPPAGTGAGAGMPEERPTAPTLSVGPRRGRPRKAAAPVSPLMQLVDDPALELLYAKVGKLSIYAARAGKDVSTFAHELRALLDAYEQLLKRL